MIEINARSYNIVIYENKTFIYIYNFEYELKIYTCLR
jgi:hypothetical protein